MVTFFDSDCVVGRRQVMQPESYYETATLVERMGEMGVGRALVTHSVAREYNAVEGNALAVREVAGRRMLEAKWVAMPHHTGEFPDPGVLRAMLKENSIRSVAMYPADHNFSLEPWCCGELLAMLEACNVPLFVEAGQVAWGTLDATLSTYPRLPLVLTHLYYGHARFIYPLLERHERLAIETFGFKNYNGIEDVCKRFGANRLIFGSGAPIYPVSAAIGMVTYA
ncbi:MAG: hypothetical protein FWF84_03915, partial [Kiritimatiellaeota bacterium]|nr:hypothetical protein [Kiritimatiellota bacterium]